MLTSKLYLLQISLHNQMLDVGASHEEPLAPSEVDRANLGLNNPAVAHDAYHNVQILWWPQDRREQIEFVRVEHAPAELKQ